MKGFLKSCIIFAIFATICCFLLLLGKVARYSDFTVAERIDPNQPYLFIGDSHIGCTFLEEPQYRNRVLWGYSMPTQFTLMRLKHLEEVGALGSVRYLITEIGLQTIGQQSCTRLPFLWYRMLPLSWRYPNDLPLSFLDKFWYTIKNYDDKISLYEVVSSNNVSILDQPEESRKAEFEEVASRHFGWIVDEKRLCQGWEESLKVAITGIKEICDRHGIKVLFITAPLTKYYRDAIPTNVKRRLEELTDYIQSQGIKYMDLSDQMEDNAFMDCFHLRLDGERQFTKWFYAHVIPELQ